MLPVSGHTKVEAETYSGYLEIYKMESEGLTAFSPAQWVQHWLGVGWEEGDLQQSPSSHCKPRPKNSPCEKKGRHGPKKEDPGTVHLRLYGNCRKEKQARETVNSFTLVVVLS